MPSLKACAHNCKCDFVTGLVSVNLDFFPAAPPPPPFVEGQMMEIPTMRSSFDSLLETVGTLPLQVGGHRARAADEPERAADLARNQKRHHQYRPQCAEALEQTATAARDAVARSANRCRQP